MKLQEDGRDTEACELATWTRRHRDAAIESPKLVEPFESLLTLCLQE